MLQPSAGGAPAKDDAPAVHRRRTTNTLFTTLTNWFNQDGKRSTQQAMSQAECELATLWHSGLRAIGSPPFAVTASTSAAGAFAGGLILPAVSIAMVAWILSV